MNFAAIDIGTNSIRLLIAEYKNERLNRLVNKLRIPRLGEGINDGVINAAAQQRAIKVLKEYKELIDKYQADYRAVATSAIRDAENKRDFLKQVKEKGGIEIDIIEGLEEAKLSYLGIINGLKASASDILAIDIGGGSTEFIFGTENGINEYESINLGAVRLKESYNQDIKDMYSEANKQLKNNFKAKDPKMLIGVGGTITTLAAMDLELNSYQPEKIQDHKLDINIINDIFNYLFNLSLEERKEVVGLKESRADIIIPGLVILLSIMRNYDLTELRVSDSGILEGIIYNNLSNGLRSSN